MSEENKSTEKVEQSTGEAKKAADQEKSKAKKANSKKPEKQKDVKVKKLKSVKSQSVHPLPKLLEVKAFWKVQKKNLIKLESRPIELQE